MIMLITFHLQWLLLGIYICLILLGFFLWANLKIRQLRIRLNKLLAEKAELIEEIDNYEAQVKKPLGFLFEQDTKPYILSFDKNGKILKANDFLLDKFGYTKRQLIGKKAVGTILPQPKQEADNIVYRLFKNPNLFIDTETETITKTGQKLWISWTNKIIYDDKGKAVAADAVGFDISKRKELEAELRYLSSIDPQTGALNRPALLQTATTELRRAQRYKRGLSIVIFQLQSQSKASSLSDTQLKEVTHLTTKNIRAVDYLGRIGDAEFALVLPETSNDKIPILMQRITGHLNDYNKKNKTDLILNYAFSSVTKNTKTIDELLNRALQELNRKIFKGTH